RTRPPVSSSSLSHFPDPATPVTYTLSLHDALPICIAFIVDEILEQAREGRSVADLISFGSTLLTSDDVMPGVAEMMPMIQVEGRSEEHTSELQSRENLVCRLLPEKKK